MTLIQIFPGSWPSASRLSLDTSARAAYNIDADFLSVVIVVIIYDPAEIDSCFLNTHTQRHRHIEET